MFGYDYNNLNIEDLRKLAGIPEELLHVEEAKDEKAGDAPPNIPGPSGGEDELLDEVDEDEEDIAVEEAKTQSEIEAQTFEEEVSEDAAFMGKSGESEGKSDGELEEAIEGELNNGYKKHHVVKKDGYFPTGQDQSVSDEAGPSSAKHGDNPMQKRTKIQVKEARAIHKDLVYGYRSFLKEMDNPLRILQDEHRDLAAKLTDAKTRNDQLAIASIRTRLAANEDKLQQLETPKF